MARYQRRVAPPNVAHATDGKADFSNCRKSHGKELMFEESKHLARHVFLLLRREQRMNG
jgi:hypothetical protein